MRSLQLPNLQKNIKATEPASVVGSDDGVKIYYYDEDTEDHRGAPYSADAESKTLGMTDDELKQ